MTLQEVLKKAIKAYFDGEVEYESHKLKEGGPKYNKQFFDDFSKTQSEEKDEDE